MWNHELQDLHRCQAPAGCCHRSPRSLPTLTPARHPKQGQMFPEAMLQQGQMGQQMGNESFPMPGRYVGTIIGKQGAMIQQLQNQSGARIQIQQGSHGADGTCELIGAPENIRMAKQLIEA